MRKLAIATVTALVALSYATVAVFAWESRIEGKPAALEAGGSQGYYFWHDQDGLHLWTTDPENVESHFTGVITTNGSFENVVLERPENDDHVTVSGPGTLTFSFHTYSGIDGVDFTIDGGSYVHLELYRDGHRESVDNIFLGEDGVHPDHNPFTVFR